MRLLLLSLLLSFISCKPEPEFYINGKPYYTSSRCTKIITENKFGPHYGYNALSGKFEIHTGSYTETTCIESTIDTIEIK